MAQELLKTSEPVNYTQILKGTDILLLGESHIDYTIAEHLQKQVKIFKENGVTSFGFELNPAVQEF